MREEADGRRAGVLAVDDDPTDDDRVAADALAPVLRRDRPAERVHAALAGGVGGVAGKALHRHARRAVDDRAAAGCDEVWDRVLARPEHGTGERADEDPIPLLVRPLVQALDRLGDELGRGGVVDEGGERAEPIDGGVDRRLHAALVAHVEAHEVGVAASLADPLDDLLALLDGSPAHHDLGALGGEDLGDRAADPTRRAADQRDLSVQAHRPNRTVSEVSVGCRSSLRRSAALDRRCYGPSVRI